jgi:protein-tyrosine kinase
VSTIPSGVLRSPRPAPDALFRIAGEVAETNRIWSAVEKRLPADGSHPCVLVTSAGPAEGKSLLAAGLALLLARQGTRRVILADMNWHRPSLHRHFGLTQENTLETIRNTEVLTELISPSGLDQLAIFTAPLLPAGAQERHGLELGGQVLRQLKTACDLLVVDTASVYPTNRAMMDPVVLSREADAALLVVRANASVCSQVKRARYALETSGVRFIGLVYNPYPTN